MTPHKIVLFNKIIDKELSVENNNVLVCCASFEERSKVLPLRIPNEKLKAALVCIHEDGLKFVKGNADDLCGHFGKKAKRVMLSLSDPLKTSDSLLTAISEIKSRKALTYLVDITTFTHESLLILLNLLLVQLRRDDRIKFIYTTASDYSAKKEETKVSEKEPDDSEEYAEQNKPMRWLSKGIREIRSVLGFPGVLLPSKKLHLIVLGGYEEERASRIIENYEANFVSIGIGAKAESIHPSLYKINEEYHKKLCNLYQNVETFSFSLTDPLNTKLNIQSQIARHPECNTVIAPLNTKISTVGAALIALENRDIQLSYAQVNYYNVENYSAPGDEFYFFNFSEILTNVKIL